MEVLQSGPQQQPARSAPVLEDWAARAVSEALAAQGTGFEQSWNIEHGLAIDADHAVNEKLREKRVTEAKDCFVWKGMEEDGVA